MTIRSTRRAVSLAIASAWLASAGLAGALPAVAAPAAPAASASTPAAGSDASAVTQYTVKAGQSLADVAAAATQSHDKFVLGRAAKAIFDANPSAFMRGDPSLLKLGAVLKVPPLDATGTVVKAESAPAAASAAAANMASAGSAAPQVAGPAVNASGAQATKPASAPAGAVSQAPASTAASASAKTAAPAAMTGASGAAPATPHLQPAAPGVASGTHAWAGAIEPAPAVSASAVGEVGAGASGVAAASGATAASASAAAAGAAASPAAAASAPSAAALAPAASASAASHPKVSSLQQLLTLKNHVLMELQRHGFGVPSAGRSGEAANTPAGASGFAVPPPASGAAAAPVPGHSRVAAAANERFIGIDGVGFTVARKDLPAVAAIAAAVVAALLVLLVALGISRRKRRAPAEPARPVGGAAGAASTAPSAEPIQPTVGPAASADDPVETELLAILARNPTSKRALMSLAGHYAERQNVQAFDEIAQRIHRLSGGRGPNWVHVASLGRQLDPNNPLFALDAGETDEAVLTGVSDAGEPSSESTPDTSSGVEPPVLDEPIETPTAPMAATPPPVLPAEETAPSVQASPEAADASLHSADPSQLEHASANEFERSEASAPPEPERAAHPLAEATLPPEAVAALNALDIGLPPRVDSGADRTAGHAQEQEQAQAHEPEYDGFEEAAAPANAGEAQPHDAPGWNAGEDPNAKHEHSEEPGDAHPAPAARPGVAGLGAAPIGPLALSFDLDLPGVDAGGHNGAPAAAAPLPEFTPEQLAKIARNKLDLAAEYIALGDLGGARTLIHEVIESKDAATRDEAHALLATLAPLS